MLKVIIPEDSLLHGINGKVMRVYTGKSIFTGMKKTFRPTRVVIGQAGPRGVRCPLVLDLDKLY
jgi:hypothetical protein